MRRYLRDNVVWRAARKTYHQSSLTVKRTKKDYIVALVNCIIGVIGDKNEVYVHLQKWKI